MLNDNMKTIIIDGVEYNLTPKTKNKVLEQHLKFEVYPKDLGKFTWEDAKEACVTLGDGWRLPTREELHLMWLNKDDSFADSIYWSCSEKTNSTVWYQVFYDSNQYCSKKNNTNYVRPVRSITI